MGSRGPALKDGDEASARPQGTLGTVLHGACLGAFFGVGVSFVDAGVAIYTGSYLATDIIAMVAGFWGAVGAAGGAALALVPSGLLRFIKRPFRAAIPPAIILAAGFILHGLVIKETIMDRDSLGAGLLLHWGFLSAGGTGTALIAAGLALGRGRHSWMPYFLAASSMLFAAGAAYFVRKDAAAATLVLGPLALVAVFGPVMDRLRSRALRATSWLVITAAYGTALFATAAAVGEAPLSPIERQTATKAAKEGNPNVIIIVVDTLRADRTSLCGHKCDTTPNLVRLGRDSRLFTHAASVDSCTLPAHASLFTGKYPRAHGAHQTTVRGYTTIEKYQPYFSPLEASQTTLATYLSREGYVTGGIVGNYSRLCRQLGMDQGFAYYHDLPRMLLFTAGGTPVYRYGIEAVDRIFGQNGKLLQPYYSARAVTKKAETWVRENKGRPFFLFLNYMDPHYPYSAGPPFDHLDGDDIPYDMKLRQRSWQDFITRFINTGEGLTPELLRAAHNQYDGELAYADHWIGRLIETLKEERLYDNTLIVVTSDHGEYFGEHGFLDHSIALYEEGVRIPIVVKYPGQAHAGEVSKKRASIIDIFATVFDVLGIAAPEDVPARPLGAAERTIMAENYESGLQTKRYGQKVRRELTVVLSGDYKYIHSTSGPEELYDLAEDPTESKNLATVELETAGRLESERAAWLETTPPLRPAPPGHAARTQAKDSQSNRLISQD